MANTEGGIRYYGKHYTEEETCVTIARCVLRRLRLDCLHMGKIENDSKTNQNFISKGKTYLTDKFYKEDLTFWCNAANISETRFKRTLLRDIKLFENKLKDD